MGQDSLLALTEDVTIGWFFPYENVNDAMGVIMRIDVQAIIIDEML